VGGWLLAMDVHRVKPEFYALTPLWTGAFLVAAAIVFTLTLPREVVSVAAADEPSTA
jgi:hypothetical protein